MSNELKESMKTFAEIDKENTVVRVIVAESIDWCEKELGGVWVECFKKGAQRGNYPGPGYSYNAELDAFIPPKDFDSWVLDENTLLWIPPTPKPDSDLELMWDEESLGWIEE